MNLLTVEISNINSFLNPINKFIVADVLTIVKQMLNDWLYIKKKSQILQLKTDRSLRKYKHLSETNIFLPNSNAMIYHRDSQISLTGLNPWTDINLLFDKYLKNPAPKILHRKIIESIFTCDLGQAIDLGQGHLKLCDTDGRAPLGEFKKCSFNSLSINLIIEYEVAINIHLKYEYTFYWSGLIEIKFNDECDESHVLSTLVKLVKLFLP